jgi:hypothetical protein
VAAISLATAVAVYFLAVDPRHMHGHSLSHSRAQSQTASSSTTAAAAAAAGGTADPERQPAPATLSPPLSGRQVWNNVRAVLGIRSFQIIVLQASRLST